MVGEQTKLFFLETVCLFTLPVDFVFLLFVVILIDSWHAHIRPRRSGGEVRTVRGFGFGMVWLGLAWFYVEFFCRRVLVAQCFGFGWFVLGSVSGFLSTDIVILSFGC